MYFIFFFKDLFCYSIKILKRQVTLVYNWIRINQWKKGQHKSMVYYKRRNLHHIIQYTWKMSSLSSRSLDATNKRRSLLRWIGGSAGTISCSVDPREETGAPRRGIVRWGAGGRKEGKLFWEKKRRKRILSLYCECSDKDFWEYSRKYKWVNYRYGISHTHTHSLSLSLSLSRFLSLSFSLSLFLSLSLSLALCLSLYLSIYLSTYIFL